MEKQERLKLKKTYEEMPEEQLIEIILEDEKEYRKAPYEAYGLLLEEARRRGIEEKINDRKNRISEELDSQAAMGETKNWVAVHKCFDILEVQELEQILKDHNIPVVVVSRQDSAFDGLFKASIGEAVLQVREDYEDEAKRLIADFKKEIKQQSKYKKS